MFAVYGMTEEFAKQSAERTLDKQSVFGKLRDTEMKRMVEEALEGKKVGRVSPVFSTPQIAEQWLELALKAGGLRLRVYINHPVKEEVKNGRPSIKRAWSPYVHGKDYRLFSNGRTIG